MFMEKYSDKRSRGGYDDSDDDSRESKSMVDMLILSRKMLRKSFHTKDEKLFEEALDLLRDIQSEFE